MSIKVKKWIPYYKAEEMPHSSIDGFGGFFNFSTSGQRWKDFIERFNDSGKEYVEALRSSIIELGIRNGGSWHQSDKVNGVPVFSDGSVALFSMRGWGDLMAAIYSELENKDYSYCDFAWED